MSRLDQIRLWLCQVFLVCAIKTAPQPTRAKLRHWIENIGKIQTVINENCDDGEDFQVTVVFENVK